MTTASFKATKPFLKKAKKKAKELDQNFSQFIRDAIEAKLANDSAKN
jgi:hypothetical protein